MGKENVVYIYDVCHLLKKEEILPFVTRMDLEGIMLIIIRRILKKKKELIDTNNRLVVARGNE